MDASGSAPKARIASKIDTLPAQQREQLYAWMIQGIIYSDIAKLVREKFEVSISAGSLSTYYSKHSREILGLPTNPPSSASWLERRESLLNAACIAIAALRKNGVRIGQAIRLVARKFRKRSLGARRRLRLSSKSLRRHWDAWNAAGRNASAFRTHYRPGGAAKAELDRSILPSIVESCFRENCTLAQVLRSSQPAVSKSLIYSLMPAREIQKCVFAQRRLTRLGRELEQRKAALIKTVIGETA